MESEFDDLDGVKSTMSGYIGGHVDNPTYKQVSTGRTGHTEALEVVFNPTKVTYERLLEVFWDNIDPHDATGQFCDKGSQYRSGIFYIGEEQKKQAEASKAKVAAKLKEPVVTEVTEATTFYPAEDYHQDYYKRNPLRYKSYRAGCGRDQRLREVWGKK